MSWFKSLDIYPKTMEDFRVKTFAGGAISLISLAVIALLVFSEFLYYMEMNRTDALFVDTSEDTKIPINLNITFPSISCDALSIDVMDVAGEHQIGIEHTIFKQRLDLQGKPIDASVTEQLSPVDPQVEQQRAAAAAKTKDPNYCGSCYGSEAQAGECCNTCEAVKQSYLRKGWAFNAKEDIEQCYGEIVERKLKYAKEEGCSLGGYFLVNKVAGNFHFSPGRSLHYAQGQHVHDYLPYEVEHFNTSHIITRLSFGQDYPGLTNPLDGKSKIVHEGSALFQYFVKVVPTIYEYANGKEVHTNQYSVTEHFRPKNAQHPSVVPGIYFMFDLSPIMVHIKETRKNFLHFITNLCAIIGGVFTVSSILDSLLYHVSQRVAKKVIVDQ